MDRRVIPFVLRERLGVDGTRELNELIERHGDEWRAAVVNTCADRFDGRLREYAKRDEMAEAVEKMINTLADIRVELVRWSFAFWVGQIAVILAALVAIAKLVQP